jgi:CheY-like chemotaxis protein
VRLPQSRQQPPRAILLRAAFRNNPSVRDSLTQKKGIVRLSGPPRHRQIPLTFNGSDQTAPCVSRRVTQAVRILRVAVTDNLKKHSERSQARLFLVDDHALMREYLTALIEAEADLAVCGEAEDAPTALSLILLQEPNLVILDLSLKRSSGFDLLRELQRLRPNLPVLVLSMHDQTLYAQRSLEAGALGYITKEEATVKILSAIRRVLAGGVYLSDRMAGPVMERLARVERVTVDGGRV